MAIDTWAEITAARHELADQLETLDDEAWNTPSLCDKWTVKQLVGHLVMPLTTSLPKIALAMAGSGFSFDKANDKLSRKIGDEKSPQELIAALRDKAHKKFKPRGPDPKPP